MSQHGKSHSLDNSLVEAMWLWEAHSRRNRSEGARVIKEHGTREERRFHLISETANHQQHK